MNYKFLILALFALAIHGCSQGFHVKAPESAVQVQSTELSFKFVPNTISVADTQASITISGDCVTGNYTTHFVRFKIGTQEGQQPNLCLNGKFSVSLPRNQVQVPVGAHVLEAQLKVMDSSGQLIDGPADSLFINVTSGN